MRIRLPDRLPPRGVLLVPSRRIRKAALERVAASPPHCLGFRGIDAVAVVVPRAVGDELDKISRFPQQIDNASGDIESGNLEPRAEIVAFAA